MSEESLSRGASYARLHGVPPGSSARNQNPLQYRHTSRSVSFTQDENRPRVQFNNDENLARMVTTQRSRVTDPELEAVMREYGLGDADFQENIPQKPKSYSEHTQRLAAFGVSLSNRLSHFVIAYPFIVLRRQCQINLIGKKYHISPFGLVAVALNMQRAQGLTCLWKGIGSYFVVSALTVSAETALGELPSTKLPRELSSSISLRSLLQHLALKTCSMILILPFYSAHLIESVQSEMVSETPGIFSCVFDGFRRLFGRHQSQRMIPFYRLILPTFGYTMAKYLMVAILQQVVFYLIQFITRRRRKNLSLTAHPPTPAAEKETSLVNMHYPELVSTLIAELITDVILFPMETAVNRINIQVAGGSSSCVQSPHLAVPYHILHFVRAKRFKPNSSKSSSSLSSHWSLPITFCQQRKK